MFKLIPLITLFLSISCGAYAAEGMESIMPDADSFKKIESPFNYYEAYKSRKLIGYCFNTKEIDQDTQGYSGPMEILVAIDTDFKILNMRILHHAETQEYAAKITAPEFLSQFIGKGPESGFKVGFDVDAVTHATVSCSAVCDILKNSITHVYKTLGTGPGPREAKYYKVIDEQR